MVLVYVRTIIVKSLVLETRTNKQTYERLKEDVIYSHWEYVEEKCINCCCSLIWKCNFQQITLNVQPTTTKNEKSKYDYEYDLQKKKKKKKN